MSPSSSRIGLRPGLLRQRGMRRQMPPLAMHRHRVARLHQPIQPAQFVARRMAGDVHQVIDVGHQLHATAHQIVLHRADRALVAGDDAARRTPPYRPRPARRADACPAAMRASALRGSPWLPVTSISRLSSGTSSTSSSRQERRQIAADSRTRAPRRPGCAASGRPAPRCGRPRAPPCATDLDARDVAGEAGDRDAAAQAADQRGQALPHLGFAAGMALDHRIGGIADHRQHALARRAPRAPPRRSAGRSAARDRASSRRCAARMPCGVSITSACASGMECVMRRNCSANGARSIAPPGGTTCSFTWLSSCTSASLRRSTAAANGVA